MLTSPAQRSLPPQNRSYHLHSANTSSVFSFLHNSRVILTSKEERERRGQTGDQKTLSTPSILRKSPTQLLSCVRYFMVAISYQSSSQKRDTFYTYARYAASTATSSNPREAAISSARPLRRSSSAQACACTSAAWERVWAAMESW